MDSWYEFLGFSQTCAASAEYSVLRDQLLDDWWALSVSYWSLSHYSFGFLACFRPQCLNMYCQKHLWMACFIGLSATWRSKTVLFAKYSTPYKCSSSESSWQTSFIVQVLLQALKRLPPSISGTSSSSSSPFSSWPTVSFSPPWILQNWPKKQICTLWEIVFCLMASKAFFSSQDEPTSLKCICLKDGCDRKKLRIPTEQLLSFLTTCRVTWSWMQMVSCQSMPHPA